MVLVRNYNKMKGVIMDLNLLVLAVVLVGLAGAGFFVYKKGM